LVIRRFLQMHGVISPIVPLGCLSPNLSLA
jgi:hypothetical protein